MSNRGRRLAALTLVLSASVAAVAGGAAHATTEPVASAAGPSGTIRLATDTPPDPWDPALATPNDPNMLYYQAPYDFLVNTDADGNLVPGLATSWEQDASSLTLTLREGVTFTDGTPFDAEAVKVNIEHMQNDGIPPNQGKFATVESVEVLSPTQVRLNFSAPTPQLIHNLARQQGLIASPAAIAAGDLATTPVGTGGWILDTEATVANSVYVFHANPDYWNADAQGVETVEIHYIPDPQARTNALLSGDVDYAVIDAQFGAQVEGEGFAMNNTPAFPYYLEVLDREGTMVPELADQRVRQAMTYAIDQETFYEVTNAGAGTPSNQWTIPGQFGFNDDFTDFGFDLDKAKALMEEAGVDGFDLTIPSYGPFDVYNEAIVGFLAEIGINVSLEAAPTGNLSGAAASGQYAAAIVPAHEVHPNDFYRSRVAVTATQNPFQVASPEIDELMGTITGIDADDEATYEQMSAMVATDASIISLGTINCMSGWDGDRVSGVQPWIWTCGNVRLQGLHVTED